MLKMNLLQNIYLASCHVFAIEVMFTITNKFTPATIYYTMTQNKIVAPSDFKTDMLYSVST